MGMLCSCTGARKPNKDKAAEMVARGEEMDAQVVVSGEVAS